MVRTSLNVSTRVAKTSIYYSYCDSYVTNELISGSSISLKDSDGSSAVDLCDNTEIAKVLQEYVV